tara:strand:- start:8600 stop:9622 length:1023 start_codon:yes stop_codon:yes gene_type:complete
LTFSDEYKRIEANRAVWADVLTKVLAPTSITENHPEAQLEPLSGCNVKESAESWIHSPSDETVDVILPDRHNYGKAQAARTRARGRRKRLSGKTVRKLHLKSNLKTIQEDDVSEEPSEDLLDRLDEAGCEVLLDISNLPHDRSNILSKPAVTSRYFPLEVQRKLRPDLLEALHTIVELERTAMPERFGTTVMMANRNTPPPPPGLSQDELGEPLPIRRSETMDLPCPSAASGSTPVSGPSNGVRGTTDNGATAGDAASDGTQTSSRPRNSSMPDDMQTSSAQVPPVPDTSPALSNDPSGTDVNADHLNQRLQRVRTDSTGVVPQPRFEGPMNINMLGEKS